MFTFWFMIDLLAVISMFGFGIALNMIFRQWWVSLLLFGGLSVYIFAKTGFSMKGAEWLLYVISLIGVILSAWGVMALRKSGYSLFAKR